jgi:hypothetical protein
MHVWNFSLRQEFFCSFQVATTNAAAASATTSSSTAGQKRKTRVGGDDDDDAEDYVVESVDEDAEEDEEEEDEEEEEEEEEGEDEDEEEDDEEAVAHTKRPTIKNAADATFPSQTQVSGGATASASAAASGIDPFVETEEDPSLTRALESSYVDFRLSVLFPVLPLLRLGVFVISSSCACQSFLRRPTRIYLYTFAHKCTHAHCIHTLTLTHTHTLSPTHTHSLTLTHIHTQTQTHTHTHTHTHIHTRARTRHSHTSHACPLSIATTVCGKSRVCAIITFGQ